MFTSNPARQFSGSLLLVPSLLAVVALAASCGAPREEAPEPSATGTEKMEDTVSTDETASAEVSDEMADNAVTAPAESPVSIEPPAESGGDALPEVRAVDTKQLAEIVAATTGKATVLNIWATWCGPCVHEMPDLVKFYNGADQEEIAFISLSIDSVEEISGAIPDFQRDHEIPFPIYVLNERDDEGMVKALRGEFEGVIPVTYFYDREGKLVETVLGAVTLAELNEKVQPLVAPDPTT